MQSGCTDNSPVYTSPPPTPTRRTGRVHQFTCHPPSKKIYLSPCYTLRNYYLFHMLHCQSYPLFMFYKVYSSRVLAVRKTEY